VGSEAAKGFSRLDKASGDRDSGSVVHLIYMCAFALVEKKSLNDMLGTTPPAWIVPKNDKQLEALDNHEIFYNDVDKKVADEIIPHLRLHATRTFDSKVTYAAWKHINSTYIVCEKDNAIPQPLQEMMATQPGNKITMETLDAGHSPFLSKIDETVKIVRKAIGEQV